ncbi:helix-turn-helix transcriptional regulator [Leptolyngbya sp. FACHB-261]|uniref:helix-turn-helix transcriptional regulator n=1 Tax=Leptolyngbya sp. FACHB-261 TaxID=2692806 RepID=UPI001686FA9C|nr:LuxR C-terminal-related transcriptional regulator [Leptolyngbya sp. FACHB-261]MBD2101792.1 helix-turn-helix transcriptional regulator [Leptolyngbya sp. FACHB-261]
MTQDPPLYQAILEGFNHGILIVTRQGCVVYANTLAQQICQQLQSCAAADPSIPNLIWYTCECLIQAQADYKGKRVIVDHSITPAQKLTVRITARWLEVKSAQIQPAEEAAILVILESNIPADAAVIWAVPPAYGLTPREAEVWALARAGRTYRQIAEQLFISLNTVKKHMKSALAKENGDKTWFETPVGLRDS